MQPYQESLFPVSIKGIVQISDKILLLKNEREEWELPGGKLEKGETPEECLIREMYEETQIASSVQGIIDAWLYRIGAKEILIVTYLMKVEPASSQTIKVSHEHKEIGMFSLNEIAELNMPMGYKTSIGRAVGRVINPV
ncbi:NUDIX hydrolase [Rouxiella badensis]|jgi:mutator protein MutT|uniref:NUDIX hydrolase n=1 Tax=Rouxiella badensis TaxID=1646377 RepID=A0A1X0WDG2_9GAMM|nr:NUDIX hydrolase [Rouxiella badensis]MCC3701333.1 NUDIX hydrolase [Rouxiella badensis]MCC3717760.1 NUDIX hydrolase [Rouxiella badensis]MCC3727296.1 NUDIX hydrolase [Rouxiella badensis]MCC3735011.1 NUDIX hydrolase [Rouxiella badensis]MCC3739103.1 NUDIX hydrolase [Rouxiella badensis]